MFVATRRSSASSRWGVGMVWFILLLAAAGTAQVSASFAVRFRPATTDDVFTARRILFREAMNPLSVLKERLLIAYDDEGDPPRAGGVKGTRSKSKPGKASMVAFGQIRPLDKAYSELASVYVFPKYRKQGVGRALIQELLQRHQRSPDEASTVCLLTLRSTAPLYESFGFVILNQKEFRERMPFALQLEYAAGSVITGLLGEDIVCMVQKPSTRKRAK